MSDFDDVDDLAPDVPEFDDEDLDEALTATDDDLDDLDLAELGLVDDLGADRVEATVDNGVEDDVGDEDEDGDDDGDDDGGDDNIRLETKGGIPADGDADDGVVAPGGGQATALVEDDDLLDEVEIPPLGVDRDLDVDDEIREGEFVCRSCFMAKRESALADEEHQFCRDCV